MCDWIQSKEETERWNNIVFKEIIFRNFHTFFESITHKSSKFNESQWKINRKKSIQGPWKEKKIGKKIIPCIGKEPL